MSSEMKSIAVIGAGSGGFMLVGYLGSAGHRMRLHDVDDSKLADLRTRGSIETEGLGKGFAPLEAATTDLAKVVHGAELIIVATGGHRQAAVAKSLAPLLTDGQTILLIQGNTGGSFAFRRRLDGVGCKAQITIAEMDTYPYSARRLGPAKMQPLAVKQWLQIASFPGNAIAAAFPGLQALFPTAVPVANTLSTGFTNANAMLHVANCVANATRIDHGEAYRFYAEGVTPSVARLYDAIDVERVHAARSLGASVPTMTEWFERAYGAREPTLIDLFQKLTYGEGGPYGNVPGPKSFDHNYVAEDVAVGLIPMVALGNAAGIAMPATQALIELTSIMAGDRYEATARTLDDMGLTGQDAAGIRKAADHGFS